MMNFRNFFSPKLVRSMRQNIFIRLLRRQSILKQKDFRIYAEITTFCNARCLMCNRQNLISKKKMEIINMPNHVLNRLIDTIGKMVANGYNVTFVPMGLGEPLLFPGLLALFHKLKEIDIKIYIILTTNGILLTKKTIASLINDVDEITISLNVDNKENYKTFMGVDTYDLVLENTINLLKYKKDNNLTFPKVAIQYLDSEYLKSSFWNIIEFWKPYLTKNDKIYFHEIVSEAGTTDWNNNPEKKMKKFKRYPCPECWSLIAVHSNGDVYPCGPVFYWKEKREDLFLGNILENDLYDLYFNSLKLRQIKEEMLCNNYEHLRTCQYCNNIILMPNPFFKNIFTNTWF